MDQTADQAKLRNQRPTWSAEAVQERSRRRRILLEPGNNSLACRLDQDVIGFRSGGESVASGLPEVDTVWPYRSSVNGDGVVATSVRIPL